jgi:hypothetical protein
MNVHTAGEQAFAMDYTSGERAINHHAGPVRIGETRSPLYSFTPEVVGSTADMGSPLPLQRANTVCYDFFYLGKTMYRSYFRDISANIELKV